MLIYVTSTIISVMFGYLIQHAKGYKYTKNILKVIAAVPLFLVAALRYNVGTDYPFTYTQRFLWRLRGYDISEFFEIGFVKLIDIIQLFTREPQWLFVSCAFIFSFFLFKAIYQQSVSYALSIAIIVCGGHYFAYLNLMRNYVALALCLYAMKYIETREVKKYLFWILLASTFHVSSLLYFPFYFIYNLKINRFFVVGVVISAGIGLPIIDSVARYLVTFTDYAWYYNDRNSNIVPQVSYTIISLIILMVELYSYKEMKDNKTYELYLKIQMIITVIGISSYVVPMIRRLILVPVFTQIITVAYIKNYKINKYLKWTILLMLLTLMTYISIRQITVQEMHEVLPYQTIFDR